MKESIEDRIITSYVAEEVPNMADANINGAEAAVHYPGGSVQQTVNRQYWVVDRKAECSAGRFGFLGRKLRVL